MRKALLLALLGSLLTTTAHASGHYAGQQAERDSSYICGGPVWDVFLISQDHNFRYALGHCLSQSRGFITVIWAQDLYDASGRSVAAESGPGSGHYDGFVTVPTPLSGD